SLEYLSRLSDILFSIDPSTTDIYTLSLHDALPISAPANVLWSKWAASPAPTRPVMARNSPGWLLTCWALREGSRRSHVWLPGPRAKGRTDAGQPDPVDVQRHGVRHLGGHLHLRDVAVPRRIRFRNPGQGGAAQGGRAGRRRGREHGRRSPAGSGADRATGAAPAA